MTENMHDILDNFNSKILNEDNREYEEKLKEWNEKRNVSDSDNDDEIRKLVEEAKMISTKAVEKFVQENGEPYFSGHGYVHIFDMNSRLVNYLKENDIGFMSANDKYYVLSARNLLPKEHELRNTQSMELQEVCTKAAANHLANNGFRTETHSRAE